MNTKKSIQALKITKSIFEKYHIKYWLEKGTLVGIIRDHSFVPWDSDVDISIDANNLKTLARIRHEFLKTPFELYYCNGHYNIRDRKTKQHLICLLPHKIGRKNNWIEFFPPMTYLLFSLESSGYEKPDIDYLETSAGTFLLPLSIRKYLLRISSKMSYETREKLISLLWILMLSLRLYKNKYVSPAYMVRSLVKRKMYGFEFNVPFMPELYLNHIFKDWRTPRHKGKIMTQWRGKSYGN